MKTRLLILLTLLAAACAASGCERAKGAATRPPGVRLAASGSLDRDERELARELTLQEQQLADTQAQGRYRVTMTRCAALGGETRRSCAEDADAEYEIAQAKAQLARSQADRDP